MSGEEKLPDRRRQVTFDAETVEYYTTEELGPQRHRTPEGFLLCLDVPVARTGKMVYGPGETPIQVGSDGRAHIERTEEEVFSPDSIASLRGKPVTDDHPPVDVEPENWSYYTRGVVLSPRRGEGALKDFLLADLIIYDAEMINDIEAGKREVSCGYNPQYLQVLDEKGDDIPGQGEQTNILYNHLALVERGRCGPRCSIGDKRTVDEKPEVGAGHESDHQDLRCPCGDHKPSSTKTQEVSTMSSWKDVRKTLRRAFSAKDQSAFDEAMEELEEHKKEDEPADDAEGEEPNTIEVHNHIPSSEEPVSHDDDRRRVGHDDAEEEEPPAWFKKHTEATDKRFKALHDGIEALKKWAKEEGEEPEHSEDDAHHDDDDAHHDDDDDDNLNMDRRRRVGHDRRDAEANKEILGELEFEAPPGTGDRARKARDSAFLEDSFQDTVAKAEILAPGIHVPTFDRATDPRKTFTKICSLRRMALDLAYNEPRTRGFIEVAMSGRPLSTRDMKCGQVRVLFNAVAAQAAQDNNSRATDRNGGNLHGGGLPIAGTLKSLSDINARNRERYGRRS
jgi:uncharacterized protein